MEEIYKKRRKKILLIILSIVIGLAIIGNLLPEAQPSKPTTAYQPTKKEMVNDQFNGLTGEHFKLTQLIKESMNNADSYEHVKTEWILDTDSSIYVTTKFRGTNALGAKVLNQISARYTINGILIQLIQ